MRRAASRSRRSACGGGAGQCRRCVARADAAGRDYRYPRSRAQRRAECGGDEPPHLDPQASTKATCPQGLTVHRGRGFSGHLPQRGSEAESRACRIYRLDPRSGAITESSTCRRNVAMPAALPRGGRAAVGRGHPRHLRDRDRPLAATAPSATWSGPSGSRAPSRARSRPARPTRSGSATYSKEPGARLYKVPFEASPGTGSLSEQDAAAAVVLPTECRARLSTPPAACGSRAAALHFGELLQLDRAHRRRYAALPCRPASRTSASHPDGRAVGRQRGRQQAMVRLEDVLSGRIPIAAGFAALNTRIAP